MPAVDPGGGGDEYPAGEYEVLSSETTVELLGVSDVLDVQQVTARALPSNVVFHVRFSGPQFTPTDVAYFLGRFSGYFNALSAIPNVVQLSRSRCNRTARQIPSEAICAIAMSMKMMPR